MDNTPKAVDDAATEHRQSECDECDEFDDDIDINGLDLISALRLYPPMSIGPAPDEDDDEYEVYIEQIREAFEERRKLRGETEAYRLVDKLFGVDSKSILSKS